MKTKPVSTTTLMIFEAIRENGPLTKVQIAVHVGVAADSINRGIYYWLRKGEIKKEGEKPRYKYSVALKSQPD